MILDNCEHLIETCAREVEAALSSQPSLRVLATSREPLGLPGETRWTVEPLAVPDEGAPEVELASSDAARLFVQRAQAARPAVDFDSPAMQEVAEICRRLDGIPLAIELAAALMATMSLREIRDGLAARFELLREGYRTAPVRQQTLLAAFDWSYALLDDRDKARAPTASPVSAGVPRARRRDRLRGRSDRRARDTARSATSGRPLARPDARARRPRHLRPPADDPAVRLGADGLGGRLRGSSVRGAARLAHRAPTAGNPRRHVVRTPRRPDRRVPGGVGPRVRAPRPRGRGVPRRCRRRSHDAVGAGCHRRRGSLGAPRPRPARGGVPRRRPPRG